MDECREAERLGAYGDGELSDAARAGMEEHLARCPACRAELNRLRALSHMLAAADEPAMPPAAMKRFHKAVDAMPMIELAHIAEVFGAVAASILLACSLWLLHARQYEGRASPLGRGDQIPVWETVAVARHETTVTAPEEQLTQWIVQDLSEKTRHDQN